LIASDVKIPSFHAGFRFNESADRVAKQAVRDSVIHGTLLGAYRATEPEYSNYVFRVPSASTLRQLDSIASLLRSDPRVFAAYPLGRNVSEESSYALPRDGSVWSATLTPTLPVGAARNSGTALNLVRAPMAWGCSTGDASLAVGIYDQYFSNAPDLSDNVAALYGPQTSFSDPRFQHGFRIASVIGARGNNDIGMSGVLWQTRMFLMDMISDSTAGDSLWALALGNQREPVRQNNMVRLGLQAGIINYSKTPSYTNLDDTTYMRVKSQWDRDLIRIALSRLRKRARYPLVVIAAGNNRRDASIAGAPAMRDSFPQQILVVGGAFDRTSRDPESNTGNLIDLWAPSVGVGSLAPGPNSIVDALASGNSFAAPLVVGAAGLVASFDPRLQPNVSLAATATLRARILAGSARSPDRIDGKPVLDLYGVLKEAADSLGGPICGNRVWRSGDSVLVRRGAATDVLATGLGTSVGDLVLYHGGRRIDVDYSRALVWTPSAGWHLTAAGVPSTTPTGFYWSASGFDHDGLGSSWSIVSNGRSYAYWYDRYYDDLLTVSMTLPALSSTRVSECRWQTWRTGPSNPDSTGLYPRYECSLMGSSGTQNQYREGARSGGAMSPDGRFTALPITVVENAYTLVSWAPCTPGTFWATTGNPTSENPNLCRQQLLATRPLSAFLVISDSATHSARVATGLALTERNLDWVAIAEDGQEMVLQSSRCTKSADAQFQSCSAGVIEWRTLALADGVLGTVNFSAPLADVALPDRLRSASLRASRDPDAGGSVDSSPSDRARRERREATGRMRKP
ncbi:MAG: S8 family serine peptidase, partial [Gemmatimonadota bacterium]